MSMHGSIIYRPIKNLDLYIAGDYLKTSDGTTPSKWA